MLFNSTAFLIFFSSLLAISAISPRSWIKGIILLASIIFYSYWYPPYLILLLISVYINYWCCIRIEDSRKANPQNNSAKNYLLFCIIFNLILLFGFKYLHFACNIFGCTLPANFKWTLPLGISFFTFVNMACTIDVYKGEATAKRSLSDYLLYICYFPHLIAGPILRLKDSWEQVIHPSKPDRDSFNDGIYLIFWGLLKKMIIADNLAGLVEQSFSNTSTLSPELAWLGIYCFAVQIYCDFSGYVDTAIGISKIFRVVLPINFDGPYISQSITEFWRRWHITLSNWLRDYLYIPLGGNRKGELRTYINLMITMLLGGLWHGANWTFLIWGMLHGIYLSIEKLLNQHFGLPLIEDKNRFSARIFLQQIICFHLVCLTWVFFRAKNITEAFNYLGRMFSLNSTSFVLNDLALQSIVILILSLSLHLLNRKFDIKNTMQNWRLEFRLAFLFLAIIMLLIFGVKQEVRFIYFDF